MNDKNIVQDSEVSLYDFFDMLRSGWQYCVGGVALGMIGAGVAIMVLPPKYEAVAVIQTGQVGQVGQGGQAGSTYQLVTPLQIESSAQSIERMKTASFQMKVAERLGDKGWVEDLLSSSSATSKYVSIQLLKASVAVGSAPLIELKINSKSAEGAKRIAAAMVDELSLRQADMAKPMIDKMTFDLLAANEKLAKAQKELEMLNKVLVNTGIKDDRFTQISLLTMLRVQKEAEIFVLRQAVSAFKTAMSAPSTQMAKMLEEVFIVDRPVSPKKAQLLFFGLIGGLAAGLLMAVLVATLRRAKVAH